MTKERISKEIPWEEHNRHRLRRIENWLKAAKAISRLSSRDGYASDHRQFIFRSVFGPCIDQDDYASDYQRFIFLWISFNAAYGVNTGKQLQKKVPETTVIINFLDKIHAEESVRKILEAKADDIERIKENEYTNPAYWKIIHEIFSENPSYPGAGVQLKKIMTLFERLYQIRNQVFHGNMTYSTGLGRIQVRQAGRILSALMPVILEIIKEDIRKDPGSKTWGRVHYPYPDPDKFRELPGGGR